MHVFHRWLSFRPLLGALAALGALVSCAAQDGAPRIHFGLPGTSETHIVVTLKRGPDVGGVRRIRSRVEASAGPAEKQLPEQEPSKDMDFPATFVVVGSGLSGAVTITVDALDAGGGTVGRARGRVEVIADQGVPLELTLAPDCSTAADCDDADFCNGEETCAEGICVRAEVACPQSRFSCVTVSCNAAERRCDAAVDHAACVPVAGTDAGGVEEFYCDPYAGCIPGQGCQTDADCDDGRLCNGAERCQGFRCNQGAPLNVDDGNPCTTDACVEGMGASRFNLPEGSSCTTAAVTNGICLVGTCRVSACGDGYLDTATEECEDGSANPNDGCHTCHRTSWTPSVVMGFGRNEGRTDRLTLAAPYGVAVDRAGNIFVGDWQGSVVWRIDATTKRVTSYVGTGQPGYSGDGGQASQAQINSLNGLALDERGNLYVADAGNAVIRKVFRSGVITTVAGSGINGYAGDNGPAILAQINEPRGLRVDREGNLFFADYNNNVVRKVTPGGTISTVAGNGTEGDSGDGGQATAARLNRPLDVALDAGGHLFISDSKNHRIRRVDAVTGVITTVAGTGVDGFSGDNMPATAGRLSEPWGLVFKADGTLVIAQRDNRIRALRTDGTLRTLAGTGIPGSNGDGANAASGQFNFPSYLALDRAGNIYVTEEYGQRVRRIGTDNLLSTVAGQEGVAFAGYGTSALTGWLQGPNGVAVDADGNLYIPEYEGHRIRRVTPAGVMETYVGTGVAGYSGDGGPADEAEIFVPDAVLVDRNGDLVFTDSGNHCIRRVDRVTRLISTLAGQCGFAFYGGDGNAALGAPMNLPAGLAQDGAGNIYVSDAENRRIRKIDTSGIISTVIGNGMEGPATDGVLGTMTALGHVYGVGADPMGNVYLADDQQQVIRRRDANTGMMSTVAGNGTAESTGDNGPALMAGINQPGAVYPSGTSLYIVDTYGARIRRVAQNGTITTVVGTGETGLFGDGGPATSARLTKPYYMTVDSTGNLLFADYGNGLIRKVTPAGIISTVAGMVHPGDGPFATAVLSSPAALAQVDATHVVVADGRNGRARLLDLDARSMLSVAGYPRAGAGGQEPALNSRYLNNAAGVAYDPMTKALFISERDSHVIRRLDMPDLANTGAWTIRDWAGLAGTNGRADGTLTAARFYQPTGLWMDTARRRLLVAEAGNHGLRAILVDDPTNANAVSTLVNRGAVQGFAGDGADAADASLDGPEAVTVTADGTLFITDTGNHRVRRVDPVTGIINTVLGDGFPGSSGVGAPARFFPVDSPRGVTVDPFGNVWVTSRVSVRVISPAPGATAVTGANAESVLTVYGAPPRETFPEPVTQCLSGLTLLADARALVLDACQGFVVELDRVDGPAP